MANNKIAKKQEVRSGEATHQESNIFKVLGLMASRLLGENSYAKSSIYSERLARGAREYLERPLKTSMSLAEFKMNKATQMGYLVAVKDLMDVSFDQFTAMTLWATGQNTAQVINRAAGSDYSTYLDQSTNPQRFTAGYRAAVIQFVRAVAGENGVIGQFNQVLKALTFSQQIALTNGLFAHTYDYLGGVNPFQKIKSNASALSSTNEKVVKGILAEANNGFLTGQVVGEHGQSVIGDYAYRGDDFTSQHDLPAMMVQSLNTHSLTDAINKFVNVTLKQLINCLSAIGLAAFVYRSLTPTNRDLIGVPETDDTNQDKIIDATIQHFSTIDNKIDFPETITELADKLAILDLSGTGKSRSSSRQNLQQRYSVVLNNENHPVVNDRGELVKVNYGVFELLYETLKQTIGLPLIVSYTVTRNQLLTEIRAGVYLASRRVSEPDLRLEATLTDFVRDVARYQVDQLIGLVIRGQNDRAAKKQAGSLGAFHHLMRVDSDLQSINPQYGALMKDTKKLYYQLYQSSFLTQDAPSHQ
ncbi:hypothetical protein OQI89_07240 [Lentilactobacillus diolivorans]|uniref:hypothetical protein n=1 Tax=Lentilactobacillus diolivorans TaxID=179838 RepID=UPI002468686C|nr:hypothetical protein [Lentilactobacillus diolivorans]MDH5105643.1 hypothetical protein [Lentilactobacillus diolivorans]